MQLIGNPIPLFLDSRGTLLDAGKIYIGMAGQDPEEHPISVYWDADLTQEADQPLRTLGGVIVNGQNSATVYADDGDYSQRVRDANDTIVEPYSFASLEDLTGGAGGGEAYQPLNSNLTALAALAMNAYGQALLTLANQPALQAAVGLPAALAQAGGTVTGNITRGGAGVHTYHVDPTMTSGRIFVTAAGASDPTSLPGDIWLEKA